MPVPKGFPQRMVADLPAHTGAPAHSVYNLVRALPRHRLILLSYTVAAPALKYIFIAAASGHQLAYIVPEAAFSRMLVSLPVFCSRFTMRSFPDRSFTFNPTRSLMRKPMLIPKIKRSRFLLSGSSCLISSICSLFQMGSMVFIVCLPICIECVLDWISPE